MSERNKDVEALAEQFSRFVNGHSGSSYQQVAEILLRDHRTLQQSMMRFCMVFIEGMARKEETQTDLRNEASVVMAKRIVEACSDLTLPLV